MGILITAFQVILMNEVDILCNKFFSFFIVIPIVVVFTEKYTIFHCQQNFLFPN